MSLGLVSTWQLRALGSDGMNFKEKRMDMRKRLKENAKKKVRGEKPTAVGPVCWKYMRVGSARVCSLNDPLVRIQ